MISDTVTNNKQSVDSIKCNEIEIKKESCFIEEFTTFLFFFRPLLLTNYHLFSNYFFDSELLFYSSEQIQKKRDTNNQVYLYFIMNRNQIFDQNVKIVQTTK